jgi:hypothetical protein
LFFLAGGHVLVLFLFFSLASFLCSFASFFMSCTVCFFVNFFK